MALKVSITRSSPGLGIQMLFFMVETKLEYHLWHRSVCDGLDIDLTSHRHLDPRKQQTLIKSS